MEFSVIFSICKCVQVLADNSLIQYSRVYLFIYFLEKKLNIFIKANFC